ncbi:hypothetical protein P154DRAFT_495542 [Amniculicola lignicola CBS 123094]|uniref:Alpha/beta-hydrolase n=1 Tax=Amniculicola lignicola CBS 123094 TaxID=1392246 RepID=A0A6A5WBD6_9PLEO|nr:hypothetical protein P154DRAFT_495542 [Amniculicola lignicola CBS 123094]
MLKTVFLLSLVLGAFAAPTTEGLTGRSTGLDVKISIAKGLLKSPTDGRVVLMFAPEGIDPLDDTDVDSSPNKIFGKNVYDFSSKSAVIFSGGSNSGTATGIYGWPDVSMTSITPGTYRVQAFLTRYEKVTRSDGSKVNVHFPCGDGQPNVDGFGSLTTTAVDVAVHGGAQTIELTFTDIEPVEAFTGKEIGGCNQGNYAETEYLKRIKIRSKKLSKFWGRDMYLGANIVLPFGYNAKDTRKRYPVIYSQGHWPAGAGPLGYPNNAVFKAAWDKGIIPATNTTAERPAPKLIMVSFRHESPLYDDSYAVNTANLGPYGDAINDELIPVIESTFNIIRAPYARVQEGGSTGGWESIASVIFRPDLFGVCFSSYPDSLDFHRHQDIELYTAKNAYTRADGSSVPSIRTHTNGVEVVLATVAQENHWELTFGTSTRSANQWDVWNAVYGIQGYNNYPLEPWDKVTGEIYPEVVEAWKPMDLSNYVVSNWNNKRNLGKALAGRIYIYVGSWDNYYLNEGVMEFQKRTDAVGGVGWANVTILANQTHGGNYQRRATWDYLEFVQKWVQDHSPSGPHPISSKATSPSGRGNEWDEVIARGGHKAALARQAPPLIDVRGNAKLGKEIKASVGRWDPGVTLEAQWIISDDKIGKPFAVKQGEVLKFKPNKKGSMRLFITGSKLNYDTETRKSSTVVVKG